MLELRTIVHWIAEIQGYTVVVGSLGLDVCTLRYGSLTAMGFGLGAWGT